MIHREKLFAVDRSNRIAAYFTRQILVSLFAGVSHADTLAIICEGRNQMNVSFITILHFSSFALALPLLKCFASHWQRFEIWIGC